MGMSCVVYAAACYVRFSWAFLTHSHTHTHARTGTTPADKHLDARDAEVELTDHLRHLGLQQEGEEEEEDVPLWEDGSSLELTLKFEKEDLKGGTLNRLIERLTPEKKGGLCLGFFGGFFVRFFLSILFVFFVWCVFGVCVCACCCCCCCCFLSNLGAVCVFVYFSILLHVLCVYVCISDVCMVMVFGAGWLDVWWHDVAVFV